MRLLLLSKSPPCFFGEYLQDENYQHSGKYPKHMLDPVAPRRQEVIKTQITLNKNVVFIISSTPAKK